MNQDSIDAIIMFGGNFENTAAIFTDAERLLLEQHIAILKKSSLFASEPWGEADQPDYLNQALLIQTNLQPYDLLRVLLNIETKLGRTRNVPNGPRIIDIDILFYDQLVLNGEFLQIPHPRMHLRKFNLLPVNEIAPMWRHPVFNKHVSELLLNCEDTLTVTKLKC